MKIQVFKVEGSGKFPIDMLRYDQCWPSDGIDSGKISEPPNGIYTVHLVRIINNLKNTPAVERWNSCGWKVVEHNSY